MDRTIHFGDDEADARYRIQDTSSTGGDFVLAEDLDGGTVLLEYDSNASEWVSRGSVNLSGNDITNAGSVSADTLETDNITNQPNFEEAVNVNQSPLNSTDNKEVVILGDPDQQNVYFGIQVQTTGSTSSNSRIFERATNSTNSLNACTLIVNGRRKDGSGGFDAEFKDRIEYLPSGNAEKTNSLDKNNPDARSYSYSTTGVDISISNDYVVIVSAIGSTLGEQL